MNRKLHIEMLRIIAVVMVVLNHSDLYYTYYTNTDSVLTFSVSLLLSCICRINVPLFMMITGALLIPKAESWSVIFKKRISRMLVVLVAFSALMYDPALEKPMTEAECSVLHGIRIHFQQWHLWRSCLKMRFRLLTGTCMNI